MVALGRGLRLTSNLRRQTVVVRWCWSDVYAADRALIIVTKTNPASISKRSFRSGMIAIVAVYGIALDEPCSGARICVEIQGVLGEMVKGIMGLRHRSAAGLKVC